MNINYAIFFRLVVFLLKLALYEGEFPSEKSLNSGRTLLKIHTHTLKRKENSRRRRCWRCKWGTWATRRAPPSCPCLSPAPSWKTRPSLFFFDTKTYFRSNPAPSRSSSHRIRRVCPCRSQITPNPAGIHARNPTITVRWQGAPKAREKDSVTGAVSRRWLAGLGVVSHTREITWNTSIYLSQWVI